MARKQRKNSRRANGEGSIVQRKDGRWCGVVTLGYNECVKTWTSNWSTSIFNNCISWRNNEKLVANF